MATDRTLAVIMSDYARVELGFKIGVLKELHRRELITRDELDRAIKTVTDEKR